MAARKGKLIVGIAGCGVIAVLALAAVWWPELATKYYLFRLRSSPSFLAGAIVVPERTLKGRAVRRFLATTAGKKTLVGLYLRGERHDLLNRYVRKEEQAPEELDEGRAARAALEECFRSNEGHELLFSLLLAESLKLGREQNADLVPSDLTYGERFCFRLVPLSAPVVSGRTTSGRAILSVPPVRLHGLQYAWARVERMPRSDRGIELRGTARDDSLLRTLYPFLVTSLDNRPYGVAEFPHFVFTITKGKDYVQYNVFRKTPLGEEKS